MYASGAKMQMLISLVVMSKLLRRMDLSLCLTLREILRSSAPR